MLFSKSLAVAALVLGLAAAIPITDTSLAVIPHDNDNDNDGQYAEIEQISTLMARDNCVTFNEIVSKLSDNIDILAYLSTGYYSALYVCRRMNQRHCDELAKAVGSALASIAFIVGRVTGSYPRTQADQDQSPDQNQTLAGFLRSALAEDGEVFEVVHDLTHTRVAGDENAPLEIASVRNWRYDGTLVNFDVHDFGEGNGHVLVPLEFNNGTTTATGTGTGDDYNVKSGKGPGFKISYTTREKTRLSKTQRTKMANAVASNWASHAKREKKMSNYIGLWKTGHKANFYYRIIPEVKNFGSNYESVDVCGTMARFL